MGVQSSISFTFSPADCKAVMALSRPDPGPLTRTSTSRTPNLAAFSAACCAAHWPAKGVLFRLPLNPLVPALAQHNVSPLVSVMVTVVLLNVALTCAMATVTFRRGLRFLLLATRKSLPDSWLALTRFRSSTFYFGSTVQFDLTTQSGLTQILDTLLARHRLSRSFAGSCVGARPLPAYGQTVSMTQSSITLDISKPIHTLLNLPS